MEEALNKLTLMLSGLAEKHGEPAVQTMLETASLMAMNDIIQNFFGVLFGVFLISIAYFSKKRLTSDYDEGLYFIKKTFGYGVGSVFLILSLSCLANPLLWKSMSEPKYYIVYKIMANKVK